MASRETPLPAAADDLTDANEASAQGRERRSAGRTSRWWLVALGAAGLIGVAAGGTMLAASAAGARPPPTQGAPAKAAPVVTAKVVDGPLTISTVYLADVRARARAALGAAEAGWVRTIDLREGDRVTAGQTLVVLDDRLVQAELGVAAAERKRLEVEREQAERDAQRLARLAREQVAPAADAERQRSVEKALDAQRRSVGSRVAVIRRRVARHRIVAPFDGVIARRGVDPGDWLEPGQVALEVVDDSSLDILIQAPPDLLHDRASIAAITLLPADDGDDEAAVPLELVGVVSALDPGSRTGLLRATPRKADAARAILAGASRKVRVERAQAGGVRVPRDALVYGVADVRVLTVVEGKVAPTRVVVLGVNDVDALVRAEEGDLAVGTPVITRGNERLRPGQSVRVTEGE